MNLTRDQQQRLIPLKEAVVRGFTAEQWTELGMLTGCLSDIRSHDRLLRSLGWNDTDYPGHALQMLITIASRDPGNFEIMEQYIFGQDGPLTVPGQKRIVVTPNVFEVPASKSDQNLVAVMMPFDPAFGGVYDAIKGACLKSGLHCQRVDDIWEHSTIIQDIFNLIWRSSIVVCDFSTRNANVFYECGIAHTLGRTVVPITQHQGDVPFDLAHHRYIKYLNNSEGLAALGLDLEKRLKGLSGQEPEFVMS